MEIPDGLCGNVITGWTELAGDAQHDCADLFILFTGNVEKEAISKIFLMHFK